MTLLWSRKILLVSILTPHLTAQLTSQPDLEDEIANLEALPTPSSSEKARLTEVKAELEKINQKKEEYVKEHPEHRRLVYRPRRQHTDSDKPEEELVLPTRNLFKANGLPRHPERSIYYDPVMNPFGVAPPGMPYRERGK